LIVFRSQSLIGTQMPRCRNSNAATPSGWFSRAAIALCGLVLVMFAPLPDAVSADRQAPSQGIQLVQHADVFSVLGLAIKDAQQRLRQTRQLCDRHAARSARGDVDALLGLGNCFKIGSGRPKRLLRAKVLFETPAAQGSAEAHLALGQFYRDGAIVKRDFGRAAEHFRRAARAGLAEGMIEYGLVLRRAQPDGRAACSWFARSARANARSGIRLLGDCFAYGVGGRLDRAYAKELYRKAAGLGDNTARLKLAGHPFLGTGSDIARWEGCEWAKRSAARNNIAAMQAAAYCLNAMR